MALPAMLCVALAWLAALTGRLQTAPSRKLSGQEGLSPGYLRASYNVLSTRLSATAVTAASVLGCFGGLHVTHSLCMYAVRPLYRSS